MELCDLLGPNNELVHVKQAGSAGGLSHLFFQALAAVDSLIYEAEARRLLREKVHAADPTRALDEGWRPHTLVFAIRLKTHRSLTAETLFPAAQVALTAVAEELHRRGVEVQVVGIPSRAQ